MVHDFAKSPLFSFQTFFRPGSLYDTTYDGVDGIVRGLCEHNMQSYDTNIVSQVSKHLFADNPPFGIGSDLASLNLMRGREHGVPGKCPLLSNYSVRFGRFEMFRLNFGMLLMFSFN